MRVLLAELAPDVGDVAGNLDRAAALLGAGASELAVFPELYATGYTVGDRVHRLAVTDDDDRLSPLRRAAKKRRSWVVLGAPVRSSERPGEVVNTALLV